MPTTKYYPSLSSVVTLDDFPEYLGFIKDGIQQIFHKIYIKDFQAQISPRGDSGFYGLSIVSKNRLQFKIPSTEMYLILNPDNDDDNISSFPVTVEYQWLIMAYLRSFNIDNFSFTPKEFYDMGLVVFNISEEQVLAYAINSLVVTSNPSVSPINQFVDDINSELSDELSSPITYPTSDNKLQELSVALKEKFGEFGSVAVFTTYILDNLDVQTTKEKMKNMFYTFFPEDIEEYLKNIIIPKAKVTLALSAAIEFPPSILKPVNSNGSDYHDPQHPNIKTQFRFAQALLYADTEQGFGYGLELGGTLFPSFAAIGNTGLLLQVDSLKLDLSKTTNIAEAIADGRPDDFTGVYARTIAVTLPSRWFHDEEVQGSPVTSLRVAGYNFLIGTGGVSGTFALETVPSIFSAGTTYYFENKFEIHFPITLLKKNENNIVSEIAATNYAELKGQLFPASPITPASIKFPITVSEPLISSGAVKTFSNVVDYQSYLSGFATLDPVTEVPTLWKKFGTNDEKGFRIGFNKFDITFKQNVIVSSDIRAKLEIQKLKSSTGGPLMLDISGHIAEDGDFNLTASADPIVEAKIFDFVNIKFLSLEFGKEDSIFYIGTSAKLSFPSGIMNEMLGTQEILIPKLRLYSDGKFEIVGGNGFLPINITLPLGPVKINVTGIHLGTIQREHNGVMRKYNFIGFDGAISIDPLALDARGEGIKYYYTTDNDEHDGSGDSYLHIQTIEINLVIPAKSKLVSLHGLLTVPEPGASQEYVGEIEFKVQKDGKQLFSGKAGMKLAPKFPAFIIDAEAELVKPIPLGSVSIYGFRGLIGYRYVATKTAIPALPAGATWYDYYKYPKKGININKFAGPYQTTEYSNPFSFGAGIVIGTSADEGKILALRAMMLLSIPSMFMIEGRAYLLKGRPGLDDSSEPPFWAFVAWGENSIEMGLGANVKVPNDSGKVMIMNANVQTFFPLNNSNSWFIHIGTKQLPNTAKLFKDVVNLNAMSYLMIASQGLEFGANVDYELKKNFFGIKVKIWAVIDIGAKISFERPQFGGYIHLIGGIQINVWRAINIKFNLNAFLSGEAVRPYLIYAKLQFRCSIRIGFVKVRLTVKLSIKWEKNKEVLLSPIPPQANASGQLQSSRLEELVKGVHMLTSETFDVKYFNHVPNVNEIIDVIPLDTYIDIKFTKGLVPNSVSPKIGGHTSGATSFTDLIPPLKVVKGGKVLRQVKHKYSIVDIDIKAWNGSQWTDYHPVAAVDTEYAGATSQKIGYWQRSGNQYDTIRILGNNPINYVDTGEPGWFIPEQYGITPSNLFCSEIVDVWHTANVLNKSLGTIYQLGGQSDAHYINGAYFSPIGEFDANSDAGPVDYNSLVVKSYTNNFQFPKSLAFNNKNALLIFLPEDSRKVELKLTSLSENVTIKIYKSVIIPNASEVGYEIIENVIKSAVELEDILSFEHDSIVRIEIIPMTPQYELIASIREQIEALFTESYDDEEGVVNVTLPNNLLLYNSLINQLEELLSVGCEFTPGDRCEDGNVLLCNLEIQLAALNCFNKIIHYTQEFPISCILEFKTLLNDFLNENSGSTENSFITGSPEYEQFTYNTDSFLTGVDDALQFEVLNEMYHSLVLSITAFLDYLHFAGKCGCEKNGIQKCYTTFQEIRWKTMSDYEYEATIPGIEAVQEEQLALEASINAVMQPVWRPKTNFYIHFKLSDKVNDTNNHEFNYYYGFKTAGPVGHFHDASGVTYGTEKNSLDVVTNRADKDGIPSAMGKLTNPDKYTLTSLRSYLDYKRSYPNVDSNLINSKPLFYGNEECKITFNFTKPLAYNMFKTWAAYNGLSEIKGSLNIAIKDPVTDVAIQYPLVPTTEIVPTVVPAGTNPSVWTNDSDPNIPLSIQILNNFITSGEIPCQLTLGNPLIPVSYSYFVKITDLKRSKLYTAIINNAFDENGDASYTDHLDSSRNIVINENKEVHKFVFMTSRYRNFAEQINSYLLNDGNGFITEAIYKLPITINAEDVQKAVAIVTGTNIDIDQELINYTDLFERVTEGIFLFKPLQPAVTTEFNLITESESRKVIAVLVRNPEPFNNPKIETEYLADTITAVYGNVFMPEESYSLDFSVLHSKDYSQCLIMNNIGSFIHGELNIRFRYKEWNGINYSQQGSGISVTIQI